MTAAYPVVLQPSDGHARPILDRDWIEAFKQRWPMLDYGGDVSRDSYEQTGVGVFVNDNPDPLRRDSPPIGYLRINVFSDGSAATWLSLGRVKYARAADNTEHDKRFDSPDAAAAYCLVNGLLITTPDTLHRV